MDSIQHPARRSLGEDGSARTGLRALVTGGAGFIGSHLVQTLVAQGAQVTVLDDLATGTLDNLAAVASHITFIEGSVTDSALCLQATQGIDTVFHLAAMVSVPESVAQPLQCHQINVGGTANLLYACKVNGVRRFVFSSSSAVYGPVEGPAHEGMVCKPQSPYGYSKWLGELLCQEYAALHNLQAICLRYFNVYGARQNPHGAYAAVVAKISYALAHNEPVIVYGDGLQTRDFVSVDQVVQANLMLAQLPASHMTGQAVNIGSGTSTTLLELIAHLRAQYPNSQSTIEHLPTRPGDIRHSTADCRKFQQLLSC